VRHLPALFVAGLAVLVPLVVAGPAQASRSCGTVRASTDDDRTVTATVRIDKGRVGCAEARKVCRAIVTGHARYHDGGYAYNSYYIVGKWRGSMSTGAWAATKSGSGAYIIGSVHFS
jgi:hypothetical protein